MIPLTIMSSEQAVQSYQVMGLDPIAASPKRQSMTAATANNLELAQLVMAGRDPNVIQVAQLFNLSDLIGLGYDRHCLPILTHLLSVHHPRGIHPMDAGGDAALRSTALCDQ